MSKKNKFIPYQLCPKCGGSGAYINLQINSTASYTYICDVCNGAKIIPMFKIPKLSEIPSNINLKINSTQP